MRTTRSLHPIARPEGAEEGRGLQSRERTRPTPTPRGHRERRRILTTGCDGEAAGTGHRAGTHPRAPDFQPLVSPAPPRAARGGLHSAGSRRGPPGAPSLPASRRPAPSAPPPRRAPPRGRPATPTPPPGARPLKDAPPPTPPTPPPGARPLTDAPPSRGRPALPACHAPPPGGRPALPACARAPAAQRRRRAQGTRLHALLGARAAHAERAPD